MKPINKKGLRISFTFLALLVVIFIIGCASQKKIELPSNVFEAKIKIPRTSVYVYYPKNGFYGLGTDTGNNDSEAWVNTTTPSDENKGNGFFVLVVQNQGKVSKGENIRLLMASYDSVEIGKKLITMNNHEFFVTKEDTSGITWIRFGANDSGGTDWQAHTIINGDIIVIDLSYQWSGPVTLEGQRYREAYNNSDQLFMDILSHIEVEGNKKTVVLPDNVGRKILLPRY